ncbi:hypothetical protein MKY51_03190 [Solibacillus sp. FSL R5-0691]
MKVECERREVEAVVVIRSIRRKVEIPSRKVDSFKVKVEREGEKVEL